MKKQLSLFALTGFGLVNAMVSYAALPQLQPADGEIGGHEYVDLGLPSGLLWATCNLGAETPYEAGNVYAWGQVQPLDNRISPINYEHYVGLTDRGDYIFRDLGNNICGTEYDAAAAAWGNGWRMPTTAEIVELMNHTLGAEGYSWSWTDDGCDGMVLGDRMFIPAGIHRDVVGSEDVEYRDVNIGSYWSGTMTDFPSEYYPVQVYQDYLRFYPFTDKAWLSTMLKSMSANIRPVYGAINDSAVDEAYFDSKPELSGIAEAVAEGAKVGVRVVGGSLVVTGAPEGASVAVYDLAGRRVMASALNGHTVDLPSLTPGVYIATVAGKSVKVRL